MNSKLLEVQDRTRKEVLSLLKEHGMCNMVRPTGFGKTHTLIKIAEEWDGPVIYVYPRNVIMKSIIKSYIDDHKGDIRFASYQKLWRYLDKEGSYKESPLFQNFKNGLVVYDESHFLGAELWQNIHEFIKMEFPGTALVGATATSIRTDGLDVTSMFGDHQPFPYTIDDAISDGIYKEPLYVLGTYDVKKLVHDVYDRERESSYFVDREERARYLRTLKSELMRIENIMNGPAMIKRNITKVYGENPEYLKFICFFARYANLYEQYKTIVNWFSTSYPNKEINIVILDKDTRDLSCMLELVRRENVIDLVFCVDKLTYGYHDDEISGVFLLRSTESEIILGQQYGRALSVTAKNRAIIFDLLGVVDIVNYSDYSQVKIKSNVLRGGKRNPKDKTNDNLISQDMVECVEEYRSILEIQTIIDMKRIQRKGGVISVLLRGVMPPWVACRELYISSSDILDDFMKQEGLYGEWSKVKAKWGTGWESKIRE